MSYIDADLSTSYDEVWRSYATSQRFSDDLLSQSRLLFEDISLCQRQPVTRHLDVCAFIGGLPFEPRVQSYLAKAQQDLRDLLGNTLCYMVDPCCLAVEFCVLKWPAQRLTRSLIPHAKSQLEAFSYNRFYLHIQGLQIHEDGCIVARGYDGGHLRNIRNHFSKSIKSFPTRQSQWAHIPLGRILENPSPQTHIQLLQYCRSSMSLDPFITSIDDIKFIFEKQWYMQSYEVLSVRPLL